MQHSSTILRSKDIEGTASDDFFCLQIAKGTAPPARLRSKLAVYLFRNHRVTPNAGSPKDFFFFCGAPLPLIRGLT